MSVGGGRVGSRCWGGGVLVGGHGGRRGREGGMGRRVGGVLGLVRWFGGLVGLCVFGWWVVMGGARGLVWGRAGFFV